MNVSSLQSIMLSIAESRSVDSILEQIVHGVAETSDLALARVWLVQANDQCPVCTGASNAPDVAALHLRASTGRSRNTGVEYSSIAGAFHRIPMGERKIGRADADCRGH